MPRAIAVLVLVVSLSGCGAATFSDRDMRLQAKGDTLYVFARSDGVSRGLCATLGGDVAFAEARWAANDGRSLQLGRVGGCHAIRHIIVCAQDDLSCLRHEERHRVEGAFHP